MLFFDLSTTELNLVSFLKIFKGLEIRLVIFWELNFGPGIFWGFDFLPSFNHPLHLKSGEPPSDEGGER